MDWRSVRGEGRMWWRRFGDWRVLVALTLVVPGVVTWAAVRCCPPIRSSPDDGLTVAVRFAGENETHQAIGSGLTYTTEQATGSVHQTTPAPASTRWLVGTGLAGGVVLLVVAHQLGGVFASAANGAPFAPGNARRIRVVGLSTIALGLAASPAASLVVSRTLEPVSHLVPEVVGPPVIWSAAWVLVVPGLVLVGLAEVFRWGELLQRDQDLTV